MNDRRSLTDMPDIIFFCGYYFHEEKNIVDAFGSFLKSVYNSCDINIFVDATDISTRDMENFISVTVIHVEQVLQRMESL